MRAPEWSRVTALYGGTFDPPHRQHIAAVKGLLENPGVARAVVIPSASPPHKSGVTSAEHRLVMCRLAFAGLATVDDCEIRRAAATDRPSYTYDTLNELRGGFGGSPGLLAWVIGADQLAELHTWNRFPEVLGLAHWIVLERKPEGPALIGRTLAQWAASGLASAGDSGIWRLRAGTFLKVAPTPAEALASREIREEIGRTGRIPENTLPEGVSGYLKTHRLYGTRDA